MTRKPDSSPVSLSVGSAFISLAVAFPVVLTAVTAIRGHPGFSQVFRHTNLGRLLSNTFAIAIASTTLAVLVGLAQAWVTERTDIPFRTAWRILFVAPVAIPLFVSSYAVSNLGSAFRNQWGGVAVVSLAYAPISYLLTSAALKGCNMDSEFSARSLGASPFRLFMRVVLPQLWPAILGGALIIFLDSMVEFDAFVALPVQTFSTDIYAQYQASFSASGAAQLSLVTTLVCVGTLVGELALRRNREYVPSSVGAACPPARYRTGNFKPLAIAGCLVIAFGGVATPIGLLLSWFHNSSSFSSSLVGLGSRDLWPSTVTSATLGVCAATLTVIISAPIAYGASICRGKLPILFERTVFLSFALPDLVAAISLSSFAGHHLRSLYESFPLLVVAYAILYTPLAVVALRVTLSQIDPGAINSARTLGSGQLNTFLRVRLPVARNGILAAWVLVLVFSIGDLSTTQVMLPPGSTTLATQFWANSSTVAFAVAAPYALVMVAIASIAAILISWNYARARST